MADQNHGASIEAEREYLRWWTSIETDVRKSILVFAHREPERLHALVKMAFCAGSEADRRTPAATTGELPPLLSPMSVETVVEIADKYEYQDPESGNTCFDRLGFAQEVARAAIEADRAQRQPILDEQAAVLLAKQKKIQAKDAEIADLRAQLAAKGQGEPVAAQFKIPGETWEECSIDEEEVMLKHGYKFRYLYAAPASAQPADPQPRLIDRDTAQAYMEETLWAFIECAGNFPEVAVDPRTWPHVLVYAPKDRAQPDQRDSTNNGADKQKGGA